MGTERADHELEIFRQFAAASGLTDAPSPGEKRPPPEPDIRFQDSSGGYTAFELVELLDQDYGGQIALLVDTKSALSAHYESLPELDRQAFTKKFGNALLHFRFLSALTFKRRRIAFDRIFARLLLLPDNFAGDVFEDYPHRRDTLSNVSVSRGKFVGPIFDAGSVGWVGDPTVPAIRQKFDKTYVTNHPIELLAYVEMNPMFPDDVWIPNLAEFLASQAAPLPFRRIWVFHAGKNKIKFCHP